MADTPWNTIDPLPAGKNQDIELLVKSNGANYRVKAEQIMQAFSGLGTVDGSCSSAIDAEEKTVTLSEYALNVLPREFSVTFTNANTYGNGTTTYPILKIYNSNNELLETLPAANSRGRYAGNGSWEAGDILYFRVMAGRACIINSEISTTRDLQARVKDMTLSALDLTDANKTLPVNSSAVDGALANYDKADLWTDRLVYIARDTILQAGKEITFTINVTTIEDLPVAIRGIVITRKNSLNNRCIQLYLCNQSADNAIYYRYIEWNGSFWGVSINWKKLATETDLNNALANYQGKFKTKQITDTTSANGNINFLLSGLNTVVVSVQSYNDEGVENDTIIIPYKLGDNKPTEGSVGPTSTGRWGGHCVSSNGTMEVKANTLIHCTVHYYEI